MRLASFGAVFAENAESAPTTWRIIPHETARLVAWNQSLPIWEPGKKRENRGQTVPGGICLVQAAQDAMLPARHGNAVRRRAEPDLRGRSSRWVRTSRLVRIGRGARGRAEPGSIGSFDSVAFQVIEPRVGKVWGLRHLRCVYAGAFAASADRRKCKAARGVVSRYLASGAQRAAAGRYATVQRIRQRCGLAACGWLWATA